MLLSFRHNNFRNEYVQQSTIQFATITVELTWNEIARQLTDRKRGEGGGDFRRRLRIRSFSHSPNGNHYESPPCKNSNEAVERTNGMSEGREEHMET